MRRTIALTAGILLAIAGLTACGDDAADTTAAPATTAAPTTEAPATTAAPTTTEAAATTAAPTTTEAATTTTDGAMPPPETEPPDVVLTIEVPAFEHGGVIPVEYSCDGANDIPEIRWEGIPAGTTSLALTVVDPDGGDWIHWAAWNIPPENGGIAMNGTLPEGSMEAANDYAMVFEAGELFPGGGGEIRIVGWDGPCPGPQAHEYYFTVYALTGTIDLPAGTPGIDIIDAIEAARADGSLIGEATQMGMYPAP